MNTNELNHTICLLRCDGTMLKYILDEFKTSEMCEIAVSSAGSTIQYVPDKFLDKKISDIALRSKKNAKFIKLAYLSKEQLFSVISDPLTLVIFLSRNRENINYIQQIVKEHYPHHLQLIPAELMSIETMQYIAEHHKQIKILNVPKKYQTPNMQLNALIDNRIPYSNYPEELKTLDTVKKLIISKIIHIKNIPDKWLTAEMCIQILKYDYSNLAELPMRFLTEPIIWSIIVNTNSSATIPEKYLISKTIIDFCNIKFESIPDKFKTDTWYVRRFLICGRLDPHASGDMCNAIKLYKD